MFGAKQDRDGRTLMLTDALVFTVEGEPYRWRDVILSAVRWGAWHALETQVVEAAACVKHAEATGQPLPDGVLDAEGREFRYALDLVSAKSMEDWLSRWGLSVNDWMGYLRRKQMRARWPELRRTLAEHHPLRDEDALRLTLVDAICSGELDKWARTLARRAAIHANGSDPTSGAVTEPGSLDSWPFASTLFGADTTTLHAAESRLRRMDDAFRQFRAAHVTARAVEAYVGLRHIDWVRVDCRVMAFPDEGMAAEAALLLRDDGEGFTGVYSAAHTLPRADCFFLDQIDAGLRGAFLGARTGDLIGPMRVDGEYVLYLIEEKTLPTPLDPAVMRRAEEGVLEQALERQTTGRVRWHLV